MSRSSVKPPYCDPYVLKLVDNVLKSGKVNVLIKIRSRSTVILNKFVGFTFGVYNGKDFIPVKVNENMVGRKFGEFSPTRKFNGHSGNKKVVRK